MGESPAAAPAHGPGADSRAHLRADCAACIGLCCVGPGFARSADFALTKPAGQPCAHLGADDRCGIHGQLRARGFRGCVAFDCFGAGQALTRGAFAGRSWREGDPLAADLFAAFHTLRLLHEMRWHLADAARALAGIADADADGVAPDADADADAGVDADASLRAEVRSATVEVEAAAASDAGGLDRIDAMAMAAACGGLLERVSAAARQRKRARGRGEHRGADLAGAALAERDLVAADLRGASLLGADLRGADLRWADLLGADLRGARLDGADLRDALFVTQTQISAAAGDQAARLDDRLRRPAHWLRSTARPLPRADRAGRADPAAAQRANGR